jgi:hypothetical protein
VHLLTCFPGWTWEYIDAQMTIPRLLAINEYQSNAPPLHIMVASYFGLGKKAGDKSVGGKRGEPGFTDDGLLDAIPRSPTPFTPVGSSGASDG